MGIKITELCDLGFVKKVPSLGELIIYYALDKTFVETIIVDGGDVHIYTAKSNNRTKVLNNFNSILRTLVNMKHPPAVAYSRSSKINSIFADEEESQHGDSNGT